MKTWTPSFVNMVSYTQTCAQVSDYHSHCLEYFDATCLDCELTQLKPAASWENGPRSHYRLNIHTYKGWKVYMLMTGCFATIPEYETF